jgi:hypothetical protein
MKNNAIFGLCAILTTIAGVALAQEKVPTVCVNQSGIVCAPGTNGCFTPEGQECNPAGTASGEALGPDISDDSAPKAYKRPKRD